MNVPIGQLYGIQLVVDETSKDDDKDDCAGQKGRQLGGSNTADEHYRCMLRRDLEGRWFFCLCRGAKKKRAVED
jgi:hypothetical protein